MELTPEIKSNCEQLGYEVYPTKDTYLSQLAKQFGYQPLGYGAKHKEGVVSMSEGSIEGELITLPEGQNKYNNGVYLFIRQDDGATVMQTIVPNTQDKGDMIQKAVDSITTHIKGMDMEDFQLFDYVEMWGYVIAETTLKPLAKSLYPDDKQDTPEEKALKKSKREQFVFLSMPRVLVNTAHYYVGDEQMAEEERVNSEPYVIKMMIDQETDKKKEQGEQE